VTTIRWLNFILCYKKIFNLKQKSKKRNFDAKKFISTQQKATSKRIASSQSETTS
jgi:23S rRNA C2498 (ribose-2'-O)-methylase RlmM